MVRDRPRFAASRFKYSSTHDARTRGGRSRTTVTSYHEAHHAQSTASDDPARGSGPRCSVLCGRLRLLSVSPFLHSSQDPTIVVAIAELAESSTHADARSLSAT